MYNRKQFLERELMDIFQYLDLMGCETKISQEEYNEVLQVKINKETQLLINKKTEQNIKVIKNGTRSKSLLTFNGFLIIKIQRFLNLNSLPSLYKKFARTFKAFENFLRLCLLLDMPYRMIQLFVQKITRGKCSVSFALLARLSKTKDMYVDAFNKMQIVDNINYVFIDACKYKVFNWYNPQTGEWCKQRPKDPEEQKGFIRRVRDMAVYAAIGIDNDGFKHLLGINVAKSESSPNWYKFLKSLKNRGLKNPKLFLTDDFNGFNITIKALYPKIQIQKCVVHKMRNALDAANTKDVGQMTIYLRKIFKSFDKKEAFIEFAKFSDKFRKSNKKSVEIIENALDNLFVYFDYPSAVRKYIYTNNFSESFFGALRTYVRRKEAFYDTCSLLRYVLTSSLLITHKWNSKRVFKVSELNS